MPLDFKVSRLGYKDLARNAQQLRQLGKISPEQKTFDVVDLLHNTVIPVLAQRGTKFSVEIDNFMENPAEVDLEEHVLHLADGILAAAKSGEFRARLVVAHEIAHMILHKDQVMAFSASKAVQLNFLDAEESAERQAQDFALLLLLPDEVVIGTRNMALETASIVTLVEPRLIEERRMDFEVQNRIYLSCYVDNKCPCGSEAVAKLGGGLICKSCGEFI